MRVASLLTGEIADTCLGRKELSGLSSGPYIIQVSDCIDRSPGGQGESGDYSITLSVVSDGASNCAVRLLSCPLQPPEQSIDVPGEVQAFSVEGLSGESATLSISDVAPAVVGPMEMRLFDPDGHRVTSGTIDVSTCLQTGAIAAPLGKSGMYTVLMNTCQGLQVGTYHVGWQAPSCPAVPCVGDGQDRTERDGDRDVPCGRREW